MPSDPPAAGPITGRCYCGTTTLTARRGPRIVAYCHCSDCRCWTGAPVAAFAAFETQNLKTEPPLGQGFSVVEGVERWTCPRCGSPLAATFDYLPGQVYVPLGLLNQADDLPPALHCHHDARLRWLHIADDLPRTGGSARADLGKAG